MSQEAVEQLLDADDPVGSLVRAVLRYEAPPAQPNGGAPTAARRIRYFFEEPSVRQAVCTVLDRAAQRIAPMMVTETMNQTQARVAANALAFGYFGALEQWYIDGAGRRSQSTSTRVCVRSDASGCRRADRLSQADPDLRLPEGP